MINSEQVTDEPGRPVEASANADDPYKLGSSSISVPSHLSGRVPSGCLRPARLGKMALGLYLPWRFKASNPFHSDVPWKGMEDEGTQMVPALRGAKGRKRG